jgi:hypothetical protein
MAGYFAMRAVAAWAGLTAGFEGQLSRQIISLMAGLVSTGGVFIVAAWLLRMEELHDFLRALVRRKAA